jgi:NADPH:quinone reductase-like Zn-dependent oxidoreductase
MRAVVLTEYGNDNGLHFVKSVDKPSLSNGDVRIRVRACALSDLDLQVCHGDFKLFHATVSTPVTGPPSPLSIIPGYEIAGEIDSMGT